MIQNKNTITLNMGLCEERHAIPQVTDGYFFPSEVNPTDTGALWDMACNKLLLYNNENIRINLYVTGLTVALVTVINICITSNIKLTLWHYNRDTNDYFSQEIVM